MASPVRPSEPGVANWEPGASVGRFTLLTPLAEGGMAEIWLARQSGLQGFQKLVVIKRMSNALASDPEYVEMFLTEARLAAQLTHPNVVQIYELSEESGSLYIVMEYVDGEDLSVVRRSGLKLGLPLPDHHAVRLVSLAAEGLHYAHTRTGVDGRGLGIVHRDISPQNLIVTFDGGVKVLDFGIARAASNETNSGKLKGKLAYMSPEQARGEPLDPRSDVFSLGIVLFELITRTRLLPKMNDLELLAFMAGSEPLPLASSRRADLPAGLEEVLNKALARKREQRYQSAREFNEALEAWLRQCGKLATAGDLSDYLRTVFTRRIHQRRELIEAAMRADLTPSSARHLSLLARKGGTGASTSASTRDRVKRRGPLLAVGSLAVLVLIIFAAVGKRIADASAVEEAALHRVDPPPAKVAVVAPRPPELVIATVPPGATVSVDGEARGPSPQTVTGLPPGAHQLAATLEGHQRSERAVNLKPGERLVVELALIPEPVAVAPPPPVEPTLVRHVTKRPKSEASGKLTLKTTPWTTVYLGSKKLGDTPLLNQSLPAGRHVLRLVNPESGLQSSIEVTITANETTVKIQDGLVLRLVEFTRAVRLRVGDAEVRGDRVLFALLVPTPSAPCVNSGP